MKALISACATLVALLLPDAARSDTLYFRNGDRLTGSLVRFLEDKFSFSCPDLGTIEAPRKSIESFSTGSDVEVWLHDGSVLTGPVSRGSIALDQITEINPAETGWKGSMSLGLQLERGNTESNGADVGISLLRRFGKHRIQLRTGYSGLRGRDTEGNEVTDRRKLWGGAEYDHFVSERWFWFGHSDAERDALAELALRLIMGGGFGYQIIDTPDLAVSVRSGLNWVRERYDTDSGASDYPGGRFAWELSGRLNDSLSFTHNGAWVPSLKDFGNNQLLRTRLALRQALWGNWFAEARLAWQLNTAPAPDTERQDASYALALGWSF